MVKIFFTTSCAPLKIVLFYPKLWIFFVQKTIFSAKISILKFCLFTNIPPKNSNFKFNPSPFFVDFFVKSKKSTFFMEKSTFLVIFVKVEGWIKDQNDRQILMVILVLHPALYLYKNHEKSRFFHKKS